MTTHYGQQNGRPICGSPEDTIGGIITCQDCVAISGTIVHPLDGHGYWYSMRDHGCDCRARFASRAEHARHVISLRAATARLSSPVLSSGADEREQQ